MACATRARRPHLHRRGDPGGRVGLVAVLAGEPRRVGVGRVGARHDDPVGLQLGPQGLGEAPHRELRRGVRRVAVHPDEPDGRRHEQEVAPAPLEHRRHHGPDGVQRPEVVDGHLLVEHAGGELLEVAGLGRAGAGDEHVHRAELGGQQPDRGVEARPVGDVGRLGGDPRAVPAVALQVLTGSGEALHVAGDDRHPGPAGQRLAGRLEPDAARPAGDEHVRVGEAGHARIVPYGAARSDTLRAASRRRTRRPGPAGTADGLGRHHAQRHRRPRRRVRRAGRRPRSRRRHLRGPARPRRPAHRLLPRRHRRAARPRPGHPARAGAPAHAERRRPGRGRGDAPVPRARRRARRSG